MCDQICGGSTWVRTGQTWCDLLPTRSFLVTHTSPDVALSAIAARRTIARAVCLPPEKRNTIPTLPISTSILLVLVSKNQLTISVWYHVCYHEREPSRQIKPNNLLTMWIGITDMLVRMNRKSQDVIRSSLAESHQRLDWDAERDVGVSVKVNLFEQMWRSENRTG